MVTPPSITVGDHGLPVEAKRLGTYWARSEGLAALVAQGEAEGSVVVLEPGGDLLEELLGALDVGGEVAVDVDEGAGADGGSV
jgi:hypothetical protein